MKDIFNEVTSLQELNIGKNKMSKQSEMDDFTEEDLIEASMDFWKFKEKNEIVGVFERWEDDSYGQHAVLKVDDDLVHLPNLMALNGKLKTGSAKEGNKVKIVHKGQVKSKNSGRTYEDFNVFIKE